MATTKTQKKNKVKRGGAGRVVPEPLKLTLKQELFCTYYTTEGETFSNATLSYAKAYNYDLEAMDTEREVDEHGKDIQGSSEYDKAYKSCNSAGSQNLAIFGIIDRIREIMASKLDDDSIVDSRLMSIAIKGNASDSLQAIKHRNDLKQRITKKISITSVERPYADLTDEELAKLAGE